jgi:aspartyl-tRNA(Asn)/glutamyl-tRNA(Gln) amidotransferase subunit A
LEPVCDLFAKCHDGDSAKPKDSNTELYPSTMMTDIHTTLQHLRQGKTSASDEMARAISAAQSSQCDHVFVQTAFEETQAFADNLKHLTLPLAGLAVSVKDLFDVAGQTSRAGSVVLNNAPAARQDAQAVARLRAAGAAFIGRTNMTEFAFSGVGINPHFGTPVNAAFKDQPRIPGGSSSGAAISVASGAAYIGLGSDTGGSIRIPAALNGLVGFKSTARRVPLGGTIPLSSTLDTVCAITRSVRDAIFTHEILAARRITRSHAPLSAYRLAITPTVMQEGLDTDVARAYERSLYTLRQSGVQIEEIKLPELDELANFQTLGNFSAAESYTWHKPWLKEKSALYDPRVLTRIMRGASMSARDYLELVQARRDWIARMEHALEGFDAVLSPTVPIIASPIAEIAPAQGLNAGQDLARDSAFFKVNSLLLRNPSAVNMLDGCAISLPCHTPDEPPVGLMVWQGAMRDDMVLNIALQIENLLQKK